MSLISIIMRREIVIELILLLVLHHAVVNTFVSSIMTYLGHESWHEEGQLSTCRRSVKSYCMYDKHNNQSDSIKAVNKIQSAQLSLAKDG
jgi:hypothetical protein